MRWRPRAQARTVAVAAAERGTERRQLATAGPASEQGRPPGLWEGRRVWCMPNLRAAAGLLLFVTNLLLESLASYGRRSDRRSACVEWNQIPGVSGHDGQGARCLDSCPAISCI